MNRNPCALQLLQVNVCLDGQDVVSGTAAGVTDVDIVIAEEDPAGVRIGR